MKVLTWGKHFQYDLSTCSCSIHIVFGVSIHRYMQRHLCVKRSMWPLPVGGLLTQCKMYYILSAEIVNFFGGLQKIILSTVYRADGNVSVMSVGCLN